METYRNLRDLVTRSPRAYDALMKVVAAWIETLDGGWSHPDAAVFRNLFGDDQLVEIRLTVNGRELPFIAFAEGLYVNYKEDVEQEAAELVDAKLFDVEQTLTALGQSIEEYARQTQAHVRTVIRQALPGVRFEGDDDD